MAVETTFYRDLAYVFSAALLGGLVARKLRQPLILGYVAGGLIISPFTPGPTVSDFHSLELLAEIGVILLMFSIGIEFHIKDLLKVKWVAVVGGTLGILGSMAMGVGIGHFMGWSVMEGVVIGAIISVASTMVLGRFLIDRGELRTEHGRVMFSITLWEDVAVVFLTIVLPSLARSGAGAAQQAGWDILKALLLIIPMAVAAAKLLPRFLRWTMREFSQEFFMVVILALCMGTAAVTQAIGLSLALGAFAAGLVLSGSDYAREALSNLLPLRDAFVALFFVTVGMLIDPSTIASNLPLLAVLIVMIVAGKALVWAFVVRIFGYPWWTAVGTALGLTQIGEFSYILVNVARDAKLVGSDVYNATLAASLATILINAAIWRFVMPLVDQRRARAEALEPGQAPTQQQHVVVCGFGRMGGSVGAALEAFELPYIIIEINAEIVRKAREHGLQCLFGDPSRASVLEAAHTQHASLVLVTIPEPERAYLTIRNVRKLNPQVPIVARAHRRADFELLRNAGATTVIQPETEAAASMIAESLGIVGVPEPQVLAYLEQYREAMEIATPKLVGKPLTLPELREVAIEKLGVQGKTIKDSSLREQFGLTVVRVTRASGESLLNPAPATLLQSGDKLQVLGLEEDLAKIGPAEGG